MGNLISKPPPKPPAYEGPKVTMTLQKFTLISQLGKGTFCKVMAVENTVTGEIMALKYCYKERLLEKKAINHIIQERGLLEDLCHPYICNLRYSFQDPQYVYMVLDLMTGGDLRVHMGQPLPEVYKNLMQQEGARIIIAEVCTALEYLHKHNIVHRDIKPDNILLDQAGHAYLTDFNVAVNFKPGQPLRSVAGTEPYMAPELFSTSQIGYYTSVDWWSLGVVMFEMIFADRPFRGKHKRENIAKGEYRMPNSKFSHISANCRAFISDLLQIQITNRLGCGLEGMGKYRQHPFFRSKWVPKKPKVDKNAVAAAPTTETSKSTPAPPPEKQKKSIKPINWTKLQQRQIPPEFVPGETPRVEIKKKKGEKDVEAEKVKEAEKEADMLQMLLYQCGELPPPIDEQKDFPQLDEKFLYFDHNFREVRETKNTKSSFVDLERVIKSCSSLLSLNSNETGGMKGGSQRSTSSMLGHENSKIRGAANLRDTASPASPVTSANAHESPNRPMSLGVTSPLAAAGQIVNS